MDRMDSLSSCNPRHAGYKAKQATIIQQARPHLLHLPCSFSLARADQLKGGDKVASAVGQRVTLQLPSLADQ